MLRNNIKRKSCKFKNSSKYLVNYIILTIIYFLIILALTRFRYAYGSTVDWGGQHYVFPDYFRKLFYETGNLFPSFAPNIGCGENIYYFSYSGLFSPIIMLSYLFPFVEMSLYIQLVSILGIWISILLLYRFMEQRFRKETAFICGLLFLLSTPLVFHSHRHIMFVSYMPFLILAMESVDLMFERKIKSPLIINTALIILSSYYFAPSSIISISIYATYSYLKRNSSVTAINFLKDAFKFVLCIIAAIMISAILIIPTLAIICSGRETTNSMISLKMLIPFSGINITGLNPYSMGISAFGIISIISAVLCRGNKARRFLGIILAGIIILPVFSYVLNVGMYLDGKVLIPFIPLALITTAHTYEEFIANPKRIKPTVVIFAIYAMLSALLYESDSSKSTVMLVLFCADALICSILILWFLKNGRKVFMIISMTLITAIVFVGTNFYDELIPLNVLEKEKSLVSEEMLSIINSDENIYRSSTNVNKTDTVNMIYGNGYYSPYIYSSLHNKLYNNFYLEKIQNENEYRNNSLTTCSSNILFNIFIGNKYLVSNKSSATNNYTRIMSRSGIHLFENKYAMPIGRSCNRLISRKSFEKLSMPEKMEAITKCIVIDSENEQNDYEPTCIEYNGIVFPQSDKIESKDGSYILKSDEEFSAECRLREPIPKNKILIIYMDIEDLSKKCDARIKINGMKNTLTNPNWRYCNKNNNFSFVLTGENNSELRCLNYVFSNGEYKISNIKAFTIDFPEKIDLTGEFKFNKTESKGDIIKGSIECNDDGYFLLTVPYEKNFEIEVDSVPQKYEAADYSFIGFPIKKGTHQITIKYTAPYHTEGLVISIAGNLILLFLFLFSDIKNIHRKSKESSVPKEEVLL